MRPIPTEFCLQRHRVFQILAKLANSARSIFIRKFNLPIEVGILDALTHHITEGNISSVFWRLWATVKRSLRREIGSMNQRELSDRGICPTVKVDRCFQ